MITFRDSNDASVRYPPEDLFDAVVFSMLDPRLEDSGDEVDENFNPVKTVEELEGDHRDLDCPLSTEEKKVIEDIVKKISTFIDTLKKNTTIRFNRKDNAGFKELKGLWSYLILDLKNADDDERNVSPHLISSCNQRSWFCNVLLGSGVLELEPDIGVVLISVDTGCNISRLASAYEKEPREEQIGILNRFTTRFTEKMYPSPKEICTIVVPVVVDGEHWAAFLAEKIDKTEWRIYWCDSLGYDCPEQCRQLIMAIIEHSHNTKLQWVLPKENYMLDVLGFAKQKDSHSCGAYVLSLMSGFARSHGMVPTAKFLPGHDPKLTERFRWSCAEVRVRLVMSFSHVMPVMNDFIVSTLHMQRRERIYLSRNRQDVGRRKVHDRNLTESEEVVDRSRAGERSNTTEECDSGAVATSVAVLAADGIGDGKEDNNDRVAGSKPRLSVDENAELSVLDLPEYVYDLCAKEGYEYGVQFCKPMRRSQEYMLNVRIRCLKYKCNPPGCGSKAAFMAKARKNGTGWLISGTNVHNHERLEVGYRGNKGKRRDAVKATIAKNTPPSLRIPSITFDLPKRKDIPSKNDGGSKKRSGFSDDEDFLPSIPPRPLSVMEWVHNNREGKCDGKYMRSPDPHRIPTDTGEDEADVIVVDLEGSSGGTGGAAARGSGGDQGKPIPRPGPRALDAPKPRPVPRAWDSDESSVIDITDQVRKKEFLEGEQSGEGGGEGEDEEMGKRLTSSEADVDTNSSTSNCDYPAEEWVRRGFVAYMDQMESSSQHEVLQHLQYIAEYFGFKLFIRDSKYGVDEAGRKVLLRGYLKCSLQYQDAYKCPYSFKIKRVRVSKGGTDNYTFSPEFSRAHHNHSATPPALLRKLCPTAEVHARHLRNNLHLQYDVVIKFVEDKYGVKVDRELFRKRLQYMYDSRYPKDKECVRLYQNLIKMNSDNPNHKVFCRIDTGNGLQFVAWCLQDWCTDYERFGIIPGVSVDCKAISNRFNLPLFSINGRDNAGHMTTYFMGYLGDETEESFTWILQHFKACMRVSPSCFAVDQCVALIGAIRAVFPCSAVFLDDWHLNQRQTENTQRWCKSIGRSVTAEDMRQELHDLRRSTTVETFEERRTILEQKYFSPSNPPPRWYKFLYRDNPSFLIRCHKDLQVLYRFLFQGSGYSESSNARYRRNILNKDVPFSEVPLVMAALTKRLIDERRNNASVADTALRNRLATSGLPLSMNSATRLVQNFTRYSIQQFIDRSVRFSAYYRVTDAVVLPTYDAAFNYDIDTKNLELTSEQPLVVLTLTLYTTTIPSRGTSHTQEKQTKTYNVYLHRREKTSDKISGRCSCRDATAFGFPCCHMTRVCVVYDEVRDRWPHIVRALPPRFRIEDVWHPYWGRTGDAWTFRDILNMRERQGGPSADFYLRQRERNAPNASSELHDTATNRSHQNIDDQYNQIQQQQITDLRSEISYSNGKALFDQMHRLGQSYGQVGLQSVIEYLKDGVRQLNIGRYPSRPQSKLPGPSSVPDLPIDPAQVHSVNIVNPNPGLGARARKRKKSFLERVSKRQRVDSNAQNSTMQNTEVTTPSQAISRALSVVDHPDNQYDSFNRVS